jgi:hypothetical protein
MQAVEAARGLTSDPALVGEPPLDVGDYVWAHVNFLNLFNDDPDDTGIAGVDIYKFDAAGKAIEHWDTLQLVGDPKNAVPMVDPDRKRDESRRMEVKF